MRLAYLLVASLLLIPSLATAGAEKDEELIALDLRALPEGSVYYLKCSTYNAQGAADCGFVSVWEQTNEKGGLQTSFFNLEGKSRDPDTRLLP